MRSGLVIPVRRWFVPCLLLIVAGNHAVRVTTQSLTQWKGGGFGMFSTIDAGGSRYLEVFARSKGRLLLIASTREQTDLRRSARRLPNDRFLGEIAGEYRRRAWAIQDLPPAHLPWRPPDDDTAIASLVAEQRPILVPWSAGSRQIGRLCVVESFLMRVYRPVYDPSTHTMSRGLVVERSYPGQDHGMLGEVLHLRADESIDPLLWDGND